MAAVGRWSRRVTWPQAIVLYLGALAVLAAGTWMLLPGNVTMPWPPTAGVPDSPPSGSPTIPRRDLDLHCPTDRSALQHQTELGLQEAQQDPTTRSHDEQRRAACEAARRQHDRGGLIGVVVALAVTAALAWALRGRGPTVHAEPPAPIGLTPEAARTSTPRAADDASGSSP